MSGDANSTKDVFILTHDRIFDDIGADTAVKTRTNGILE
jgi:hypothetical protein